MSTPNFHSHNHYVSQAYLKRWASDGDRVQTYRTLVPDARVPHWKKQSVRGLAYHEHLYTRLIEGVESDEFEKWLSQQFESPVEEALRRATNDEPLSSEDWVRLVRFLALQEIRTPARFAQDMQRLQRTMPTLIEDCLKKAVERIESGVYLKEREPQPRHPHIDYLPVRIKVEDTADPATQALVVETVLGRGQWLFGMKQIMSGESIKVLQAYDWTILLPPHGDTWFTSDDPVVKVQVHDNGTLDFSGKWDTPGIRIFFPLSPKHLLYTRVGEASPVRGSRMSCFEAELIRHAIAGHASRMIFADSEVNDILQLRSRVVNRRAVQEEQESWKKWNEVQINAEREVMGL